MGRARDSALSRHPVWALLAIGTLLVAPVAAADDSAVTWTVVDTVQQSGLYEINETMDASLVDFDVDGDQDVWIGYHDQGGQLWANDGSGTYTRVAPTAWPKRNPSGKIPDRHFCAWADVDLNGLPDAYCGVGRSNANSVKWGKDNELWMQLAPGQFTDVGTEWGIGELCGRSWYVAFLEANGDGYPDLYVGNAIQRPIADPCDSPANGLPDEEMKLYLNTGGAGFVSAPEFGLTGYGGVRCAEVVDLNGDGWDDLMICGNPKPRLFLNHGGTGFTDVTAANGLTTNFSDADFGDLDGDGDPDLVTSIWGQFAYRLNRGGVLGPPVRIAYVPTGGGGRSVALGDADGDDDLDVYGLVSNTNLNTNPNDMLLLNEGLRFTKLNVPPAGGIGDAVAALEGDADGRAEFLVLNGCERVGPIQLIRLVPTG